MTETLLRDRVELERARDKLAELDRIHTIEKEAAILNVRLGASIDHFTKLIEDGVSHEDLYGLKAEVKKEMSDIAKEMAALIAAGARSNAIETRAIIKDEFEASRAEQQAVGRQWIRKGAIVFAIVISLLVSGIEAAMSTAKAAGFLPF